MDEIRAGVAQYTGIAAKCRHRGEDSAGSAKSSFMMAINQFYVPQT